MKYPMIMNEQQRQEMDITAAYKKGLADALTAVKKIKYDGDTLGVPSLSYQGKDMRQACAAAIQRLIETEEV